MHHNAHLAKLVATCRSGGRLLELLHCRRGGWAIRANGHVHSRWDSSEASECLTAFMDLAGIPHPPAPAQAGSFPWTTRYRWN